MSFALYPHRKKESFEVADVSWISLRHCLELKAKLFTYCFEPFQIHEIFSLFSSQFLKFVKYSNHCVNFQNNNNGEINWLWQFSVKIAYKQIKVEILENSWFNYLDEFLRVEQWWIPSRLLLDKIGYFRRRILVAAAEAGLPDEESQFQQLQQRYQIRPKVELWRFLWLPRLSWRHCFERYYRKLGIGNCPWWSPWTHRTA